MYGPVNVMRLGQDMYETRICMGQYVWASKCNETGPRICMKPGYVWASKCKGTGPRIFIGAGHVWASKCKGTGPRIFIGAGHVWASKCNEGDWAQDMYETRICMGQ